MHAKRNRRESIGCSCQLLPTVEHLAEKYKFLINTPRITRKFNATTVFPTTDERSPSNNVSGLRLITFAVPTNKRRRKDINKRGRIPLFAVEITNNIESKSFLSDFEKSESAQILRIPNELCPVHKNWTDSREKHVLRSSKGLGNGDFIGTLGIASVDGEAETSSTNLVVLPRRTFGRSFVKYFLPICVVVILAIGGHNLNYFNLPYT